MIENLKLLKSIFLVVRLVDVSTNTEYMIDEDGCITKKETKCFEIWGKPGRCNDCISSQAYKQKTQLEKFEFIGDNAFYVIAKYFELDGNPYVLELANKVDNTSFMNSIDRHLFAEQIQNYNKKMYVDPLTGAYNRLYFEEQIQHLNMSALALFDLDHFKEINDGHGHLCGDEALHAVCKIVLDHIRPTDMLIRYGGDEFLIVFSGIPETAFKEKLEHIRLLVEKEQLEKYPDTRITVSMGGIMTNTCEEEVLKELDERLYRAKVTRNCVVTD